MTDKPAEQMPTLARKLRVTDYFTLAFGTMVGVGWLVLMDDWLRRGGPPRAAPRFGFRRTLAPPGRLCVRPVGAALARRSQRSRLHCASLPAHCQLLHRMGDA